MHEDKGRNVQLVHFNILKISNLKFLNADLRRSGERYGIQAMY